MRTSCCLSQTSYTVSLLVQDVRMLLCALDYLCQAQTWCAPRFFLLFIPFVDRFFISYGWTWITFGNGFTLVQGTDDFLWMANKTGVTCNIIIFRHETYWLLVLLLPLGVLSCSGCWHLAAGNVWHCTGHVLYTSVGLMSVNGAQHPASTADAATAETTSNVWMILVLTDLCWNT